MSEAFDLTTYYAKRIIGDTAASSESSALLQTGSGVTGDTWILHRDNRTSKLYGIKYAYDGTNGHDKIQYYGKNLNDNPTAWIQLDTGDASFNSILGKVEVTNTAIPSTGTAYYFPYITGNATGTYGLLSSNRLYLYDSANTTFFCIGATDRTGGLTIRNANGKYADIVTSAFSANRTLTIPDQTGTIALLTKTDINALINLLDTGSSVLTADDYIITQYVGGGTTTTTYHRRAAKNVRVGGLTTARNINGTAFDGTANITTANWGTTRSLTIGNKAQDVNGSAAVTWSLNDILYNATQIGTATSWDQIGPSVYYVASSSAFTGTNHPGNNSEQMPYTYGQLIVSRAGSGGILQVYASHHASNSGAINEGLRYRTGWNSGGWQAWSTLLDDRLWRKYIFANKNIGRTTLTVTDSTWAVTSGTDVFGLSFKDTGLTYTPSGGSATASSDTGDWRAWLTCATDSNTVKLNMRIDGSFQSDVLYSSYIDASGAAQPTAGKLAGLTGAHSRLYGNALYISNPTTTNDQGWIRVLGTAETDTVLEIATGDDGGAGEQIVCRQYNTSNVVARQATLLDTSGNTSFPGQVSCVGRSTTDTATADYYHTGGLQIYESNLVGNTQDNFAYAPRIGFHWRNRIAATLSFHKDGIFYFRSQNGTSRATVDANLSGIISRAGVSKSWYQGRDSAIIKTTSYSGYDAILSMKTTAGDWALGVYTDNIMYFTYILDSNYSSNTNTVTKQFIFNPNGTLTATTFNGALSGNASTATKWYSAQKVYVTLGTASTTTTIQGGSSSAQTIGVNGTLAIGNGGTNATTAENATWNLLHVADPGNLNNAKRMGNFKISNTTTNTPVATMWGATWNIVDDSAAGNNGTSGSTWQLVFQSASNNMWLRCITNAGSWSAYAKFLSDKNYTDYTVTKTGGGASGTWGISVTGSSGSCTGNAATATTASYANVINNDSGRRASSEYMHADGKMRFYLATSSMTTGKPPTGDGFIIKGGWDNTGGWDAMISWSNSGHASVRGSSGSGNATNHTQSWKAWNTILDSDNYKTYCTPANIGAAASSHSHSYLPLAGGTMTGAINFNNKGACSIYNGPNDINNAAGGALGNLVISSWYGVSFTTSCTGQTYTGTNAFSINCRTGYAYCGRMYNAVWNDYAEFRKGDTIEPGRCMIETTSGVMTLSSERLQPGAKIISDTYGYSMGETKDAKTPIAVSGRVLAYPYRNSVHYQLGAAVCSAPGGTVDIMSREEIMMYPERIVGTVSEIPNYETWHAQNEDESHSTNIQVNGRIWIYVR